jgi:CubicO group peptidase (beta-lactamase class C family)
LAGPAAATDVPLLVAGEPLEREMSVDQTHEFHLELDADRFVYLAVEQLGIDVIVKVFDPDGQSVATVDASGSEGGESVTLFNQVEGTFRVEIVAFDDSAEPGRFSIELVRLEDAASTPLGKIDQLMAQWNRLDSPGASIAVARGSEIIYQGGFGSAQLEYEIPITPKTIFHVASVSKQFTAFAVILMAERGELSLDDDIRKHIPEVPDFGKTITLRHLIHHTSGLRDQWNLLALGGWRLDDVITLEHVLTLVEHQKELNFDPGEEFLYCNTGYTLLAEVVARVSGQSFRDWTGANIFEPLGMLDTHFHDDHEMIVPNRAYSYSPEDAGFKKAVLSYANVGATSLFTTVGDLALWADNLDTGKLGGETVRSTMHQRAVLNDGEEISYASGLSHREHRGLATVGHSGGDAGFRSRLARYPDQGLSVGVLSNLGSFNPNGIAEQVAGFFLEEEMEAAEAAAEKESAEEAAEVASASSTSPEEFVFDPALLDGYTGEYTLNEGLLVDITREGDRLVALATGQAQVTLEPTSADSFEISAIGAQLVFRRNDVNEVTGFAFTQGDQEMQAERIERSAPSAEALRAYEGRYYSPELGTFYETRVEENQLVAKHRRHGTIELTSVSGDEFTGAAWFFGKARFERNDNGEVIAMRVSSGRVREVRFERAD